MRVPSGLFLATLILPFVGSPQGSAQSPAYPDPRWMLIGESSVNEGIIRYLDTQTVVEERDGVFVAWTKTEFDEVQLIEHVIFDEERSRFEYNCGARTYRPLFTVWYLGSEQQHTVEFSATSKPVLPESMVETELDYICSDY